MSIPSYLASVADWMRIVSLKVNPLLQGRIYIQAASDPADPVEGFTYYNTTSHVVRTWDGSAWQDHW